MKIILLHETSSVYKNRNIFFMLNDQPQDEAVKSVHSIGQATQRNSDIDA